MFEEWTMSITTTRTRWGRRRARPRCDRSVGTSTEVGRIFDNNVDLSNNIFICFCCFFFSAASGSSLRGSVSDTSSIAGGAGTSGSCSENEAYSRDEKRARAMNIPMTVDDIINLPMDEFNERLSKYDLTEPQLSLIRDIRRRGKNKVAAQNCRKRKLDQILTLADEVKRARERKIRLHKVSPHQWNHLSTRTPSLNGQISLFFSFLFKERDFLAAEKARIKDRFAQLYRHVFQSLRDQDGQPYSPYEYSLQQSADGNILLVPRAGGPHGSGATIDPQPSQQHQQQQHQQHQHAVQRNMMDPNSMAGHSSSNSSGVHHGARRKTPDHKSHSEPWNKQKWVWACSRALLLSSPRSISSSARWAADDRFLSLAYCTVEHAAA